MHDEEDFLHNFIEFSVNLLLIPTHISKFSTLSILWHNFFSNSANLWSPLSINVRAKKSPAWKFYLVRNWIGLRFIWKRRWTTRNGRREITSGRHTRVPLQRTRASSQANIYRVASRPFARDSGACKKEFHSRNEVKIVRLRFLYKW